MQARRFSLPPAILVVHISTSSPGQKTTSANSSNCNRNTVCCGLCDKPVIDNPPKGEESIFCEGDCQVWIHKRCSGLTTAAFNVASSSSDPFLCLMCRNSRLMAEISSLQATVFSLVSEVSTLKSSVTKEVASVKEAINSSPTFPSGDSLPPPLPNPPRSQSPPKSISYSERKYNVIVFGVVEQHSGTPWPARSNHDHSEVCRLFSHLDEGTEDYLIRDCCRIGRFQSDASHPRPILVTLGSTSDVLKKFVTFYYLC